MIEKDTFVFRMETIEPCHVVEPLLGWRANIKIETTLSRSGHVILVRCTGQLNANADFLRVRPERDLAA